MCARVCVFNISRQSAIPLPRRRDSLPTRHPRWHGWPAHGVRFGEASHPGPHSGTPVGGERQHVRERSPPRGQGPMQVDTRVFCPVPTCPCADPLRARGWRSVHTMQSHIDAHMAGSISGDVPAAWLAQHNRQRCAVCGLSVACRFGIHATCRPEARAAMAGHMHAMPHTVRRVISHVELVACHSTRQDPNSPLGSEYQES